jgi:predicted small secreted protein
MIETYPRRHRFDIHIDYRQSVAGTSNHGTTMRKIVILLSIAALTLVAGCNTISGAGKDVASVGKVVSKTADSAK